MPDSKPLLESASLSRESGGSLDYFVSNIDATDPVDFVTQALTAGGVPQEGDPFGNYGSVQSVTLSQAFPQSAIVTVQIGRDDSEGGGGGASENEENVVFDAYTAQITTSFDIDGNPILVIYNPDETNDKGDVVTPENGEDGAFAEVSAFSAVRTLSITRFETDIQQAITRQRSLVNHTNEKPFAGFDAEAWLCTRCSVPIRLVNGQPPTSIFVSYEFQATEDGWQRSARYLNPETGQAPTKNVPKLPKIAAATVGGLAPIPPRVRLKPGAPFDSQWRRNGYTIVRVQDTYDFDLLEFPLGL